MTPTILIERYDESHDQSLGKAVLVNSTGKILMRFFTLEPAWKDNARQTSCIPTGEYPLVFRTSARYARHLHVLDVPGRDLILIHAGNYRKNTLGCILPGRTLAQLDGKAGLDVTHSRVTLNGILSHIPAHGGRLIVVK